MSVPSAHQHVFRIAKPVTHPNNRSSTLGLTHAPKRNRQPVSCMPCRTRKLKCDRQLPCSSCSRRDDTPSCKFIGVSSEESHDADSRAKAPKISEAQLRLQKLESLVFNLMRSGQHDSAKKGDERLRSEPTLDPNSDSSQDKNRIEVSPESSREFSRGHLDQSGLESNYVGATHWATILENIREVQGALTPEGNGGEVTATTPCKNSIDAVIDTTRSLTIPDVLESLPRRATVDKLMSVYFNAKQVSIPVIHSSKFLKEYAMFWTDPSSVSFLWISMLYSALFIGSQIDQNRILDSIDHGTAHARPSFLTRAGQALVTGQYQKTKPYSVEAVLLYGVCKYMEEDSSDTSPNTESWIMLGIAARLAIKMGYHRDPRNLTNITPLQGEMRRRTFWIIEAFDTLFSSQAGLPAVVHEDECDNEPPRNLFDSDFDEDCKVLPPSRPPSDPTPMLYPICKGHILKVFRRILRQALSPRVPEYSDVMRLDGDLRGRYSEVPPSFRIRSLSLSITDPPNLILNRMYIELTYLKSICVLHRNYLAYERFNKAFDYSRKECGEAALQILAYQAELHDALQPGGLFCDDQYMLSNLTLHDFLLGAMIASLDLWESHLRPTGQSAEYLEAQAKKYDVLTHAHSIWLSRIEFSQDARRASNVLAAILHKVPRPDVPTQPVRDNLLAPKSAIGVDELKASTPDSILLDDSNFGPVEQGLNNIFNDSEHIDWALFDQVSYGRDELGDLIDWSLTDHLES